jgi:uncharacterized damage-inducible protein DinB
VLQRIVLQWKDRPGGLSYVSVFADALRTHLDYTIWANRRLLQAAAQLSDEELNRDFGTADRSVLGALTHVSRADQTWLARITGNPNPQFPAETSLAALQTEWPALHERWKGWALGVTDQAALAEIVYQDFKGRSSKQPLWQLVLHMVNHGTHHRGQVSGFLRAMGHAPPPLDLVFYYREPMGAA